MTTFPLEHEPFLTEALRAPSAHNAQPWRLVPLADDSGYELHYNHHDYLPHDPDDRDAYLAMGAFYETLAIAAQRHEWIAEFTPRFERSGDDLFVGSVTVTRAPVGFGRDPLAQWLSGRTTNRTPYQRRPIPPALADSLSVLGCVFVRPSAAAPIVAKASMCAWRDRQFVTDLRRWVRFGNDDAPDGMTPYALALSRIDTTALRFAFRRGALGWLLAWCYSRRDVRLTQASATVAVLEAESLAPAALFDAGRRLLRAWTVINACGYSYHPISITIDRPETAPALAELAGVPFPVAMFRVGFTDVTVPKSNRRALAATIVRQQAPVLC